MSAAPSLASAAPPRNSVETRKSRPLVVRVALAPPKERSATMKVGPLVGAVIRCIRNVRSKGTHWKQDRADHSCWTAIPIGAYTHLNFAFVFIVSSIQPVLLLKHVLWLA